MNTRQEEKRRVLSRLASVITRLEQTNQESQRDVLREAIEYNITNTEYIREHLCLKTALPSGENNYGIR
jgi:hypothetical protein